MVLEEPTAEKTEIAGLKIESSYFARAAPKNPSSTETSKESSAELLEALNARASKETAVSTTSFSDVCLFSETSSSRHELERKWLLLRIG